MTLLDEGNGPALLLFHGWNGSVDNFDAWLPALTPHFRVIAPDLPGCADVPPLAEKHTAAAYARWTVDVLDAIGVQRAVVGGLCSGTAIALAFAEIAPDRTHGLLLHTPFLHPRLVRPLIRAQLTLLGSPVGLLWGPVRKSTLLSTLHRRIFANAAEVEAPQLARDQADLVRADPAAGRELARDLLTVDRTPVLRAWRAPVAVLLAEHDAFVDTPRTALAIAQAAPHAVIERFPGGHGWTPAYRRQQHTALARLALGLRV
ncbi:MAG TPA: alpha/beta fold hydrolase [Candidatus Limnocylindria bacterium]|nr:alpha/beta fold hydrolase [Candidatus Limnocylindria bacterium]